MIWRAQLLFYQGDADCFFIVQPRCNLGPGRSFGIIAAPLGGHRWRTPNSGKSNDLSKWGNSSFIREMHCFFIVQARCDLGPAQIWHNRRPVLPGIPHHAAGITRLRPMAGRQSSCKCIADNPSQRGTRV
jgi:hypothetical protein